MEAVAKGTCKAFDAVMMIYITTNMDNASGDCTRKADTMAAALGVSRSKIFESLARLKDEGLIERKQSFGRHGRQLATRYLIGPAVQAFSRQAAKRSKPRPQTCTPGSRILDSYKTPSRLHPSSHGVQGEKRKSGQGNEASPASTATDWGAWQEWLADQVNYPKHWSDGSRSDAKGDLEQVRETLGDAEALRALQTAKQHGWYGPRLRTILLEWTPSRARAA